MIHVMFVCHGNICRSPMAAYVFKKMVQDQGLSEYFMIDSAATSTEEIGHDMHKGTKQMLTARKIPFSYHQAKQITQQDYTQFQYIVCMDSHNIRNLKRHLGGDFDKKITKLLDFTSTGGDIADPWYTGDFNRTYQDVIAGCKGLLDTILSSTTISLLK